MADNSKQDGGDINIGGRLITLEWTLAALSAIVLGLRLTTASVILKRVRMADYMMILSFVREPPLFLKTIFADSQ
jgi:hypothetical protein